MPQSSFDGKDQHAILQSRYIQKVIHKPYKTNWSFANVGWRKYKCIQGGVFIYLFIFLESFQSPAILILYLKVAIVATKLIKNLVKQAWLEFFLIKLHLSMFKFKSMHLVQVQNKGKTKFTQKTYFNFQKAFENFESSAPKFKR
jgi:hypothetical protein